LWCCGGLLFGAVGGGADWFTCADLHRIFSCEPVEVSAIDIYYII